MKRWIVCKRDEVDDDTILMSARKKQDDYTPLERELTKGEA